MSRPVDLPDFDNPPLNEVVLGVQFAPPRGYQSIYAKEIWELFRKDFPKVQERPPFQPAFETFGRLQARPSLSISQELHHNRFCFLSENGDEAIQFQKDRLFHNWRRVGDRVNPYPRFEKILPSFESELSTLDNYFTDFSSSRIHITQCELSYINHIYLIEEDSESVDKWIRLVDIKNFSYEVLSFKFSKKLVDNQNNPYGRLFCEIDYFFNEIDEPLVVLSLTIRGIPREPNIPASINFLRAGRETIVNFFCDITTEFAHKKWGKK